LKDFQHDIISGCSFVSRFNRVVVKFFLPINWCFFLSLRAKVIHRWKFIESHQQGQRTSK